MLPSTNAGNVVQHEGTIYLHSDWITDADPSVFDGQVTSKGACERTMWDYRDPGWKVRKAWCFDI